MQLRFTLSDLFFLLVVVALLVCLFQSPAYDHPDYDDLLLRYNTPMVPLSFQDKGRPNPAIDLGAGGTRKYTNGSEFFLQSHFHGWTCVTYPFVFNEDYWNQTIKGIPAEQDLPEDRWTVQHLSYAENEGRMQAMRVINRLIDDYGEDQLRERLKRIPWYRQHMRKFWFGALIGILLLWLAVKFQSTRKAPVNENTI